MVAPAVPEYVLLNSPVYVFPKVYAHGHYPLLAGIRAAQLRMSVTDSLRLD